MTTSDARTYPSLEAFYEADEHGRRRSPEADFGVHWRNYLGRDSWRVSYVQRTGEVYATKWDGRGLTLVLGIVPTDPEPRWYDTLDHVFEGWADRCWGRGGLEWVRQRLSQGGPRE